MYMVLLEGSFDSLLPTSMYESGALTIFSVCSNLSALE